MALTKTPATILASQSNAAGATVRGAIDVRTQEGGRVTLRITNGATGPTAACECRVMVSHSSGALPATGAEGAEWKRVYRFSGGIVNSAVTSKDFVFGPDIQHIQVEYTGNTGQAVTVEALATTYAY